MASSTRSRSHAHAGSRHSSTLASYPHVSAFLSRFTQLTETSNGWDALCPSHADTTPSLGISVDPADGRILLNCRSHHCSTAAICGRIGCDVASLYSPESREQFAQSQGEGTRGKGETRRGRGRTNGRKSTSHTSPEYSADTDADDQFEPTADQRVVAEYIYQDESGKPVMRVQRLEPGSNGRKKSFRQHKAAGVRLAPDGITRVTIWESGVRGVKTVPYRLPLLLDPSRSSEIVFITEGEKCADLLHSFGLLATTAPEGSEKFSKLTPEVIAKAFTARRVVILPDNDSGGYGHARQVASLVSPVASVVRILPLDDLREPKDDVFEWLTEYGHTVEELLSLAEESLAGPQRELSGPTATQTTTANAIEGSTRGEGVSGIGSTAPATTVNEDASDPHRLARAFLEQFAHPDRCRLVYWRAEFWEWRDGAYVRIALDDMEPRLNRFIKNEFNNDFSDRLADWIANGGRGKPPVVLHVKPAIVRATLEAMRGIVHIVVDSPPHWIGSTPCPLADVRSCVVFRNGIVDLHELTAGGANPLFPPTPNLFTMVATEYDFDLNAGPPVEWMRFLESVWTCRTYVSNDESTSATSATADIATTLNIDQQSIDCLQDWFGYLLTQDNSYQKILFLKGVPRSGKGTITRILTSLVGKESCVATKLTLLSRPFEFDRWIGKSVATITDARFQENAHASEIVETILNITGGDSIPVDRKHKSGLSTTLNTRIVMASNEFPRLSDSSQALSSRMIILQMNNSFYGKEDTDLEERLKAELPSIFMWSVVGWDRLRINRRFIEPDASVAEREDMSDLLSPVSRFVKDCCVLGEKESVKLDELYVAYVKWCEDTEKRKPSSRMSFVKSLNSAFSGQIQISKKRLREDESGPGTRARIYYGISLQQFL